MRLLSPPPLVRVKFGLKVLSPVSGLNLCLAPVSSSLVIVKAPGGFAANERASTPREGCVGAIEVSSSTASADLSKRVFLVFDGERSTPSLELGCCLVMLVDQPSSVALDTETENILKEDAMPSATRDRSLARGLPRPMAELTCHLYIFGAQDFNCLLRTWTFINFQVDKPGCLGALFAKSRLHQLQFVQIPPEHLQPQDLQYNNYERAMLRRHPTAITLTTEDVAIYEDARAREALHAEQLAQQQQQQTPNKTQNRDPSEQLRLHQVRGPQVKTREERLGLGNQGGSRN